MLSPARKTEAQRGAGTCLKLLSSAHVAVSLCPESCLPARKDCLTRLFAQHSVGRSGQFSVPTHEQRVQFSTLTHFLECLRVMWASYPMPLCMLGPQPTLPSSRLLSASFTVLPITPFDGFQMVLQDLQAGKLSVPPLCLKNHVYSGLFHSVCVCVCVCVCLSVCLFSHPGW